MSDSEEEIYSTMFSSLRHPARRKILRMLSDNPMTFSQMLEELGISSPHLTYHLENLGELVSKMDDGRYRLSTFGEASVNTMKGVEEVPSIRAKRFLSLPFRWKALVAVFIIGIVLLSGLAYVQTASLNQLSKEHESLKADLEEATAKYQQLLSLSTCASQALTFLQDVVQIDMAEYQTTLMSNTAEYRSDLGGVLEEILKYSLTSNESKIDAVLRFRNKNLSRYQLYTLEGLPIYAQPQLTDALEVAKSLLGRYRLFAGASYLEDMNGIIAQVNETKNIEITEGNTKLTVSILGDNAKFLWLYTENGVDFSPKSLSLVFENGVLKELTDGWFLFSIGSTQLDISSEEAIEIARNAVKGFTWKADGVEVSDFTVLEEPVSTLFHPNLREEPLALVPYWEVTLYLDKVYPGGVNRIAVGVWADTGEVANIRALSG
jgi:DNA-binding transcriptional ArsR family regulator